MSRGPGHVMRAVERHIADLPFTGLWVRPATYWELVGVAYDLVPVRDQYDEPTGEYDPAPTRAQLSAVSRAVRTLERQGKAVRRTTGYTVGTPRPARWDQGR